MAYASPSTQCPALLQPHPPGGRAGSGALSLPSREGSARVPSRSRVEGWGQARGPWLGLQVRSVSSVSGAQSPVVMAGALWAGSHGRQEARGAEGRIAKPRSCKAAAREASREAPSFQGAGTRCPPSAAGFLLPPPGSPGARPALEWRNRSREPPKRSARRRRVRRTVGMPGPGRPGVQLAMGGA